MDVVNGKIVSASSRTERPKPDLWGALKPSGSGPDPHGRSDQLGSYNALRGRVDWAGPTGYNSSALSPPYTWGASAPGHASHGPGMAPEPGTGRWTRSSRDTILGQPHKRSTGVHSFAPTSGGESPPHGSGSFFPGQTAPHRGWKVPSSGPVPGRSLHSARPCTHSESRALFDAELSMYESQICRDISGHFERRLAASVSVPVTPELGSSSLPGCSLVNQGSTPAAPPRVSAEEALETRAGTDTLKRQQMDSLSENAEEGVETGTGAITVKKLKIELSENDQDDCAWIAPLRALIRKGLSVSDVGELGRIVIPKKDAEGHLPQIDTKEGKLLEMADFSISKRWFFRYKWWINNKSRMYVLENTGEFIKHHGLKEHDSFVVYEDGCGKLLQLGHQGCTSPSRKCSVLLTSVGRL